MMTPRKLFPVLLALCLTGCGTMSNGRRWGEDATWWPGWQKMGESAWRAVRDPQTWGPLAAAALLQIDHADENVSEWAVNHTPVFGSSEEALDAQKWTGTLLDDAFYLSVLSTPSGDDAGAWTLNKFRGAAVEFGAVGASSLTIDIGKELAGRTRPNGFNDESFPSGHAGRSSVDVTLASKNISALSMPEPVRVALQTGLYGLGAVSAWSRVEAQAHYPSDILSGWAIGRFWGVFMTEAFLRDGGPPAVTIEMAPQPGGATMGVSFAF